MKSVQEHKAIEFFFLVKQRFVNQPSQFDDFVKLITSSNRTQLISQLKTLFVDHPDLLLGFNQFLPRNYDDMEDQPPKKKRCTGIRTWFLRDSPSDLFDKIRDRCLDKNDDEFRVLFDFSKTVLSYHENKITFYEADMIFKNLFKDDPDLFVESNRVLAQSLPTPAKNSGSLGEGGSGDVECSLYEETLDVKEFYLFEMDMVFSRLDSTIKKLEKDPESLTVLDDKCIKRFYSEDGDDGLGEDMIRILQSDPVGRLVARVVVREKLRQKVTQLKEQKNQLDKVWNEIFEDIREKGCVHRHRDFLQRTKKSSNNGFVVKKKSRGYVV